LARKTNIQLRRSASAGAIPTTSNLDLGELALNTYDGKIYAKTTEGSLDSVVQVGSSTDSYFKIRKNNTQTLIVKVVTKTADHIHHGSGSSSGYNINGIESPHLNLVPGNTYRFDQSDGSNSGHPFRFYYEADKTTAYTTGVTTNGTPGSSGAYTQIIATAATPMVLHYQCSAHGYMGNSASFNTRNFTGFDTDDLTVGSTNLYFTNALARSAISAGTGISYNSGTGAISTTITQYADSDARAAISVTDAGGDGSLAYNSSTGVITYTGPSASEVRAHISAGTGVGISNGAISIGQDVGTSATPTFGNTTVGSRLTFAYNSHYLEAGTNAIAIKNSSGNSYINITSTGVTIPGNLTVEGTTTTLNTATLDVEDKNITLNYGSGDTSSTADGAGITIQDAVDASTDASLTWRASDDKFIFSHPLRMFGQFELPDNVKMVAGDGNDLQIYHDGSNSYIKDGGTGNLRIAGQSVDILNPDANEFKARFKDNAEVELYYDNALKLATDAAGINVTGGIDVADITATGNVSLNSDGGTLYLGAGADLRIFHDGTNSSIQNTSGDLIIRNDSDDIKILAEDDVVIRDNNDSTEMAKFINGGAVELYHNGSKKIETTSTGVQTTGTVNVNGAYTLPTSDGSSGQVLQTDGSGTLSFATVSGGGGGSVSEAFKNIAVSGQSNIVADAATDTLTFAAGSNITLTTAPGTDTLTIASSGGEVTVQEEGSSLSTAATTLNFVGSGVTATGSGATKTITIPGSGSGAAASDILKRFVYTTSSSTTAFTGNDDNSQSLSYTIGAVQVYLNGVLQKLTTDYAETNTSTITFVNAIASGNVVEIVAYYRTIGTGNSVVNQFTGDGSTTAFTVTTAPQSENNLLVYIDGVYQQKTDYTTSGTTLTMDTAPASGAIIETVAMVGAITAQQDLTLTGSLQVADVIEHVGDTDTEIVFDTNDIKLKAGGATHFHASADQKTQLMSGNATTMVLDTSQNVGVGTTSPASRLHIKTSVDNSVTQGLVIERSVNTDRGYINYQGGGFNIRSTVGDPINLGETDAIHMRINPDGNVGIGTSSPAVTLDVGSKTDAVRVPNGTTAQRPTAALGQLRYNTTTSEFEGYAAGAWGKIGGGGDSFGTIAVSGQSNVVAEQENDTLTFEAGAGIVLTTDASNDKVTISGGSGSVFTTDFFTASGSGSALLAYTLSVTPSSENELICFIEGVYQNKNSYALSGTTLTFDSGIVAGQEVVVHHVGSGIVGTSPTIHTETGNGSAYSYTLPFAPPNENYIQVYWDGVYQHHDQYTVSGTTLDFGSSNVPPASTAIEVHIPSVNGIGTPSDATVTPAKLSTGAPSWDGNSNFIVGNSYVRSDSTSISSTSATTVATHAIATYRTVKYQVQVTQGSAYHTTELTAIHDGTTVSLTEYGTVFTGSSLATFDATITSGNMLLQVTMGSNASSTIKVISNAISV